MTRDEAIAKLKGMTGGGSFITGEAERTIDALIVLGLLKLDKLETGWARAAATISVIPMSDRRSDRILAAIEAAGLKIVERKP